MILKLCNITVVGKLLRTNYVFRMLHLEHVTKHVTGNLLRAVSSCKMNHAREFKCKSLIAALVFCSGIVFEGFLCRRMAV